MPFVSQAQARFFRARAAMKPSRERRGEGPSAAVARKFIADSAGQKVGKLPERVKKK